MRIIILLSLALSVMGQSKDEVRAEEKRADKWRDLVRKSDHAAADVLEFQDAWKRDCEAKGMDFNMKKSGDPGCIVRVPPPVEKK